MNLQCPYCHSKYTRDMLYVYIAMYDEYDEKGWACSIICDHCNKSVDVAEGFRFEIEPVMSKEEIKGHLEGIADEDIQEAINRKTKRMESK